MEDDDRGRKRERAAAGISFSRRRSWERGRVFCSALICYERIHNERVLAMETPGSNFEPTILIAFVVVIGSLLLWHHVLDKVWTESNALDILVV